ncbi:DUF1983 domain-containing protein, partial [Escherichia coli]|nr:DUF1983 domain-containing protein [Escherichia coli]
MVTQTKRYTPGDVKNGDFTGGGPEYGAGFGRGIDPTGLSQFLVQADRFGLVNSVNGKITTPFFIENRIAYMNGGNLRHGQIPIQKAAHLKYHILLRESSEGGVPKKDALESKSQGGGGGGGVKKCGEKYLKKE